MNENETNFKNVIITGKIQKIGYYSDVINRRKQPPKYHVNMELDESPENEKSLDEIAAFVYDSQSVFLPKWYKNLKMEGVYPKYFNTKSNYDIEIKLPSGEKTTIDGLDCFTEINRGATCKLKLTLKKDTAIYPKYLCLLDFGEAYDPFEDM